MRSVGWHIGIGSGTCEVGFDGLRLWHTLALALPVLLREELIYLRNSLGQVL